MLAYDLPMPSSTLLLALTEEEPAPLPELDVVDLLVEVGVVDEPPPPEELPLLGPVVT